MALPKPQKTTKDFPKHPAGMSRLILADIIGPYVRVNEWPKGSGQTKLQQRVNLIWQSEETEPNNPLMPRFLLSSPYTWSSHENAALPKFLSGVFSGVTSPAAWDAILGDFDQQIGKLNVLGNIVHSPSKQDATKIYVNVASIAPLMKGMTPLTVVGYTRADYWAEQLAKHEAEVMEWEQIKFAKQVEGQQNATKSPPTAPADFGSVPDALTDKDDGDDFPPF